MLQKEKVREAICLALQSGRWTTFGGVYSRVKEYCGWATGKRELAFWLGFYNNDGMVDILDVDGRDDSDAVLIFRLADRNQGIYNVYCGDE